MAKMDYKRCFTQHALSHSLAGLGVGLILISLVPSLVANAMLIGLVAIVVGVVADMMAKN